MELFLYALKLPPLFLAYFKDGFDSFVAQLSPGEGQGHMGKNGDSFVIRGPASKTFGGFRARFQIHPGGTADGVDFKYKMVFQAMARENAVGSIEFVHRSAKGREFIWIEPGHQVGHYTQDNNPFELRTKDSEPMIKAVPKVVLYNANDEL